MTSAAGRATRLSVEARPFLKTILDCVAQPVWVVDHAGLIRFANPAAIATLGYEDLSELEGKPSHETIHYKRPDGSHFPAEECPISCHEEPAKRSIATRTGSSGATERRSLWPTGRRRSTPLAAAAR